jgi:hypothetical protein
VFGLKVIISEQLEYVKFGLGIYYKRTCTLRTKYILYVNNYKLAGDAKISESLLK